MVCHHDQKKTSKESTISMSSAKEPFPTPKKDFLSTAMKRTSEWISSQEIPSDVVVHVGGTSFSLHMFPLIAKCGYIRKLATETSDAELSVIELADVPGGEEAFELAAKFCYGINFEISTNNIAMLRCVAEYLEMSEDSAVGNLVGRTEAYLNEVALKTLSGAVAILHHSESLLPTAEEVKLVSRCVDAIAYIACKESQLHMDWWAVDLTVLRIEFFHRVLIAMMARGFKQYAMGPILMLYAQKSLRGLETFGKGRKKMDPRQEHEKRVVLETVVGLLPREKNALSVSFLSMLLRAAICLDTTVSCRLDLEKRMGMQLPQAVLDDLLITSYSITGDTLFDVNAVQRIMSNFLEYGMEVREKRLGHNADGENQFHLSPPPSDMERVAKLMENYLAEIASDRNLSISSFISLAELIPEQSRVTEDGMYRAIDIYLKAHPAISDMERKKVCSLMDCQKLSREACAHAAQNDRLPVQTVVQVLYYEQQRLRDVVTDNMDAGVVSPPLPSKANNYSPDNHHHHSLSRELASLRRENQDLKLELVKIKRKLKEVEISSIKTPEVCSPAGNRMPSTADGKPPLPRKSFITSMSKKLGRLTPFGPSNAKVRTKPSKDRRHSVS